MIVQPENLHKIERFRRIALLRKKPCGMLTAEAGLCGLKGPTIALVYYCLIGQGKGANVASYRPELEKAGVDGIPSLYELESGRLVGAIVPMSEQAQVQLRDSIEVIDYLLHQDSVIWS